MRITSDAKAPDRLLANRCSACARQCFTREVPYPADLVLLITYQAPQVPALAPAR